jgi:hypothetical protein
MKILLDKNNVVIAKADEIIEKEDGFYIEKENIIYSIPDLILTETPLNPEVQKHKLVNGQIVANENYKTPEQIEAELTKLKAGR